MPNPIFHDPQRKRWRRLRPILDSIATLISIAVLIFIIQISRSEHLPGILLTGPKHTLKAVKEKERKRAPSRASHRKTKRAPSQIVLNSDEGIRGAFYVTWDPGAFSSLKEYVHQIDLLFPEWLHMVTPDGRLQAAALDGRSLYDVIRNSQVQQVDDKVMPFLAAEKAETEVFPLVNNFNPLARNGGDWVNITYFLNNPKSRAEFRQQIGSFLSSDKYRGLSLDFEGFPAKAQPGFKALVTELEHDLHARNLKLYVNMPADDDDFDYAYIGAHSDGIVLMNYDEHSGTSGPGPVASQAFFEKNLRQVLKLVPRDKIICGIGNYGYDWRGGKEAGEVTLQTAWLHAHESEATIDFHEDSLNPHYAYTDGNVRHEVWYLDAVTALNEMRAAQDVGIRTFALWRLGAEDRSLWEIWDRPGEANATDKIRAIHPGYDVDYEGSGEVLRISERPSPGTRDVSVDPDTKLVSNEVMTRLPLPYQVEQYGASDKRIALTFDDGPDPTFTPRILDVLKKKGVHATFFVIGWQAEKYAGVFKRTYREGHEFGNHTFYHPDISNISKRYMQFELNAAERLFAAKLAVRPLLFRPPYSIDQEPDTADQVKPLEIAQDMGYVMVGDKIDPNDWRDNPHHSAAQITADIMAHLPPCEDDPRCGNIVLLHDGGGDRSETVKALPMIIDGLRQRGYEIVPVSGLLGKQVADLMPPIPAGEKWPARIDALVFWLYGLGYSGIIVIFFLGDGLMTLRLLMVGSLAIFDRVRQRFRSKSSAPPQYWPSVAVLIPAFNEEKVIVNTVSAALASGYPRLRVIVVDDGSRDRTFELASEAFKNEIKDGRVLVLTKQNGGKASALNYGLARVQEEIFVGIDADTAIEPQAVERLIPHFANPNVAAVAGNTKVGNRVNLWTRWQALEYITSQNFERRALNVFGAVSVVPGAIGAWRTQLVRAVGGYQENTVAEDADLTMSLLEHGGRVYYEDGALAFTEAPTTASGLMRQRFRWSFGILQAVWKHRGAFARKGTLGWIALPNIVIFQILLPLVSPFIDLMFAGGAIGFAVSHYFHPESADPTGFLKLVVFFAVFLVIDFLTSGIAFSLERREKGRGEDIGLLAHVWLQRFAYRQLFSIVLFKTLKRALDGRPFSWDKLERTAGVVRARAVLEHTAKM